MTIGALLRDRRTKADWGAEGVRRASGAGTTGQSERLPGLCANVFLTDYQSLQHIALILKAQKARRYLYLFRSSLVYFHDKLLT